MKKKDDKKDKRLIAFICFVISLYLFSEGLQITSLGKPSGNTPYWIITLCGAIFFMSSIAILLGPDNKWTSLIAALFCCLMGVIAGWISLYADESGMGGSLMFLVELTGLPLHRVAFGFSSLVCFAIAYYAQRSFYLKYQQDKNNA